MKIACIASLAFAASLFAQGSGQSPRATRPPSAQIVQTIHGRPRPPGPARNRVPLHAGRRSARLLRRMAQRPPRGGKGHDGQFAIDRRQTNHHRRIRPLPLPRASHFADGRYDLTGLAGGETRHMWTSIVSVKTAAGWRIAAIRNMLPAAPAKVNSEPSLQSGYTDPKSIMPEAIID